MKENAYLLPTNEVVDEMLRQAWKRFSASSLRKNEIALFLSQVLAAENVRFRNKLPTDNPYINLLVESQGITDQASKSEATRFFELLAKIQEATIDLWELSPQEAEELKLPQAGDAYGRLDICRNVIIF